MKDPHIGCVDLMVDRHVRAGRGAHTALLEVGPPGGPAARRRLSYAGLQQLTGRIAQRLEARFGPGPLRIAIAGNATLETVAWWLGAMRAGHLVYLVNPQLPAAQLGALLEVFRPDLVLRDRTAAGRGEPIEPVPDEPGEELACPEVPLPAPQDARFATDARPALVLSSSGSTGRPKLCVHAHRAFWGFERNVSRAMWGLAAADRLLASGGPFFSFGLQGIHPALSVGATAVLLPEWREHGDFLRVVEAERVTVFLGVPTLYHLLQSRTEAQLLVQRSRSLRVAMSAGERLPAIVRSRWETHAGVALCDSIGATETFAPYFSERVGAGSGLRAIDGFDYEMRFTQTAGDSGETVYAAAVQGLCMMLGYLDDGGRLAPLTDHFPTQDLFTLGEAGWQFVSRRTERIKVSGLWVSPQELEEFLLHDDRVVKAAAVPLDTPEGLQRLRAYVVLRRPQEADAATVCEHLLALARSQLRPRALCPDAVCVVDDLDSTASGKFNRAQFRTALRSSHREPPGLSTEAHA